MDLGYYTHARWHVRAGHGSEFVQLWRDELARAFRAADPSATGTLIQSLDDPSVYYSFGAWPSLEAMAAARDNPDVGRALDALGALCVEALPGAYRVVLQIP